VQHWASVVQPVPIGSQAGGGAQLPLVQTLLQQSGPVVHVPPVGVHGVAHSFVCGSQMPWQQSESIVQPAFWALQTPGPKSQRGGFCVTSQTIEQQPCCEPELQVSPTPRHIVFAGSS